MALLGRIAEMKRIYHSVESSVSYSACLVVTSGARGEGKTTVAAGLAVAAASDEKHVLAMDYNWHAPALHTYFGVGIADKPESNDIEQTIRTMIRKTDIKGLDIMPAVKDEANGSRKPRVEGFERTLIERVREMYDVVIIDTSSAFPANQKMVDPIVLSKSSDGVIMVTLANVTPRQELKRALTAIETAGSIVLGVVANQWQNPMTQ